MTTVLCRVKATEKQFISAGKENQCFQKMFICICENLQFVTILLPTEKKTYVKNDVTISIPAF